MRRLNADKHSPASSARSTKRYMLKKVKQKSRNEGGHKNEDVSDQ